MASAASIRLSCRIAHVLYINCNELPLVNKPPIEIVGSGMIGIKLHLTSRLGSMPTVSATGNGTGLGCIAVHPDNSNADIKPMQIIFIFATHVVSLICLLDHSIYLHQCLAQHIECIQASSLL